MIALYLTRRYAFHLRHWICLHKLRFSLNGSCFGLRLVLRRTHGLDVVLLATYGGFGHTPNRLFFRPGGGISTLFVWFQVLLTVAQWLSDNLWPPPSWTRFIITTVITFWISIHIQPTLPLIVTVWGDFMERLLIFYCGDPEFQEFYSLFSVEKLWERELGIAVAVFVNCCSTRSGCWFRLLY